MTLFFGGSEVASKQLARQYAIVADTNGAKYLDASRVVHACDIDGVHLDADGQRKLGIAIAEIIASTDREVATRA